MSAVTSSLAFVTLESEECELNIRNFSPTLSMRYHEAAEAQQSIFHTNDASAKAQAVRISGKITVSF